MVSEIRVRDSAAPVMIATTATLMGFDFGTTNTKNLSAVQADLTAWSRICVMGIRFVKE